MYVNFIFISAFIGYCVGSAPIIGFKYGAADYKQLKGMLKKSIVIIGGFSVVMLVTGELLGAPLSKLFVGYDQGLFEMTRDAFRIFSLSFLFAGFAIFGSSFFTALNNGPVSALISFLRTMVFQIAAVLVFPVFWGIDGIWWSVVAAEVLAVAVTVILIVSLKKKYKY
jgi:Na+-driven multidrug efflux pump